MLSFNWKKDTQAGISLMASSDYVFARYVIEDKKIASEIKYLFYEMCRTYAREFERKERNSSNH
jgi:hypothetical protein